MGLTPSAGPYRGEWDHCDGNGPFGRSSDHLMHMSRSDRQRTPNCPGGFSSFPDVESSVVNYCLPVLFARWDSSCIHLHLDLVLTPCFYTTDLQWPGFQPLRAIWLLPCSSVHYFIHRDSIYLIISFLGFPETSKSLPWLLNPYRHLVTYNIDIHRCIYYVTCDPRVSMVTEIVMKEPMFALVRLGASIKESRSRGQIAADEATTPCRFIVIQ